MVVMTVVKSSLKVNVSVFSMMLHLLLMSKNSSMKLSMFSQIPLALMTRNSLHWHLFTAG